MPMGSTKTTTIMPNNSSDITILKSLLGHGHGQFHGHGQSHGHERVVKLLSVTGGSDTVPLSPCLNPALSVISIKVHELLLVLQTGVGGVVC